MVLKTLRVVAIVVAVLAVWSVTLDESQTARAQSPAGNAMFSNYYAPAYPAGVPATMYPSPRPTPPFVGHTYITYEPLAPHEFLYPHKRTYVRYHPGSGYTTTRVWWAN